MTSAPNEILCQPLRGPIGDRLDKFFQRQNCFVEVSPGKVIMPRKYADICNEILDSHVREDDVWMISYPRTGSTWAQEMVWLLGNNLDYEGAKNIQTLRSPLLEITALLYEDYTEWVTSAIGNSVQQVSNLPSPRFIKSHLPLQLLPGQLQTVKPKTIYVARNPKDLCVSYYHYCTLVHGLGCSFDEFCEIFLTDNAPMGPVWPHMLAFWKRRNDPNMLFLKYEDMKKDLSSTIHKCAKFLGVEDCITHEDVLRMCDHLKFDRMQKNPAVNIESFLNFNREAEKCTQGSQFIRKGQIGDWKNYMSNELSERFDEWTRENTAGTGLEFDYE